MNILIIIDSLGSGGAERSTAVISDYLFEKQVPFTILCLDRKEIGVQQKLQEKGYDIRFLEKGSFYKQSKLISKIIKEGNYCVVHSILFRSNLRTRFAKLFVKFNHLESLVNTTYSKVRFEDKRVNSKLLSIYKKIDAITARKFVDHFHSITHTVKNHYIDELHLNGNNFTVIYRGRKPLLENYISKPTTDLPRLINLGRHEFQKGQLNLLKAVHELNKQGYRFTLDIYGREGQVTSELKAFIAKNALSEIAFLRGFSHDVPQKLLESDIFVFPSLYEGLGGSMIEAQSAALPIACNDIPVLREVVNGEKNAQLFDVDNVESIVKAIKFFLDNPIKMQEYGKRSLRNFEANFLENQNNAKMLELYQTLC